MRGTRRLMLVGLAIAALAAPIARAQTGGGVPNALQGFSTNRDKPIRINATTLEVRDKDKEKRAIFTGNVRVVQGDTTLRCATLIVYYEPNSTPAAAPATQTGPQQIRRLEAKGGVIVTQKDQTATGDNGVFDMRSNTVTLIGNVVVTQGQNVVRGDRLTVDLTTGVSRVESTRAGDGRVEGLFLPSTKSGKNDTKNDTKDAPKSPAKQPPNQPLKLN